MRGKLTIRTVVRKDTSPESALRRLAEL